MNSLRVGLMLMLAGCCAPLLEQPAKAQSQTPVRYSLRTFTQYNPFRVGYASLPVQVVGAGGGKLGPNEKFKLLVSMLKNGTEKTIKAVKFSSFIFNFNDRDELVETRQTSLIPLDLLPFERRKVDILVGYVDDIPLLIYKPGQAFHLEVAVTEVHYEDGSIWQATDLPQKLDPSKLQ